MESAEGHAKMTILPLLALMAGLAMAQTPVTSIRPDAGIITTRIGSSGEVFLGVDRAGVLMRGAPPASAGTPCKDDPLHIDGDFAFDQGKLFVCVPSGAGRVWAEIPVNVPKKYKFTLIVDPPGAGTVTTNRPLDQGYVSGWIGITAVPATGYKFDHWSGGTASKQNPEATLLDSPQTVTANFVRIP